MSEGGTSPTVDTTNAVVVAVDKHAVSKHKHNHKHDSKDKRLMIMITMVFIFFWVELIGGVMFKSLALVADAVHMLSDSLALIIGLAARKLARKPASASMTYGYGRAEVVGGFFNAVFLLAMSVFVTFEAIGRFIEPEEISDPKMVVIVGGIGLLMNILGIFMFHDHGHGHSHGHDDECEETDAPQLKEISLSAIDPQPASLQEAPDTPVSTAPLSPSSTHFDKSEYACFCSHHRANEASIGHSHGHSHSHGNAKEDQKDVNMESVFLHVLGDALGSVAVLISALLVWFTDWNGVEYADPAASVIITILIVHAAIPLMRQCAEVLLQFTPSNLEISALLKKIQNIPGVYNVHDLHVWRLSGDFLVGTVHISCEHAARFTELACQIKKMMHDHGIHATTIQPEYLSLDLLEDSKKKGLARCDAMCATDWGCMTGDTCCSEAEQQAQTPAQS